MRIGGAARAAANPTRDDDPAAVDAAIARVLDAEARAHAEVERAAREADSLVDDARARARAIGERAEARVRRARHAYETAIATEVARIEVEAAAQEREHPLDQSDRDRVARAVARVAADLTGAF